MRTRMVVGRDRVIPCKWTALIVAAFLQLPGASQAAAPAAPAPGGITSFPDGVAFAPSLLPGPPPEPPRSGAKFDMTGNWVSIVSEDYQWRMITPPKGDFSSLPLNQKAVDVATAWNLDADNAAGLQCKAFGAPAIMRQPGRLRISWQDDVTLKIETDAGQQTRLLGFASSPPPPGRSWQGRSIAQWEKVVQPGTLGTTGQGFGIVAPGPGGALKVVTTNLRAGYLRKNGVPYSEDAVLTEYFNRIEEINGESWLVVTTIVEDPVYLNTPFITSTHFLKEKNGAGWDPSPCHTDPPRRNVPPDIDDGPTAGQRPQTPRQ